MKTKKVEKPVENEDRKQVIEHRLKEDYEGNDEKITIEDYVGKTMT